MLYALWQSRSLLYCTLRHQKYSSFRHTNLTPSIRSSLHLMIMLQCLRIAPDREVRLHHSAPRILCTDASDIPGRTPQRLLAVMFDPIDNALLYPTWPVPPHLISTGSQRNPSWVNSNCWQPPSPSQLRKAESSPGPSFFSQITTVLLRR